MASKLHEGDVRRIAELARLELTPAEIDQFARQLTDILTYVEMLQEVDTSGVPPTSHPFASTAWRDDTPAPSLDRDTVLQQAPAASPSAGLFKVPKVL